MKSVVYGRCWMNQEKRGRSCEIEEIYDGDKIVGPGRVLFKCQNHADVPDEELYAVMQTEGLAVLEARLSRRIVDAANGAVLDDTPAVKMRYRFEGTGKNRTLKIL